MSDNESNKNIKRGPLEPGIDATLVYVQDESSKDKDANKDK